MKYLTAQNNGLLVTDLNVAQGQSREIVVISLVRSRIGSSSMRSSTPLGKLNSPHQVATLMTKGRRLVFVFGCARHFLDANNKFWNLLMSEAEWPVINDQI
jgi:hypothetical protein